MYSGLCRRVGNGCFASAEEKSTTSVVLVLLVFCCEDGGSRFLQKKYRVTWQMEQN